MKNEKVILITGPDGYGKSSLARQLEEEFLIYTEPLARCLRIELVNDLGVKYTDVYAKPTPQYIRDLLRGWSRHRKIQYSENYWLGEWVKRNTFPWRTPVTIIDDVRYLNEVEFFNARYDTFLIGFEPKYFNGEDYSLESFADIPKILLSVDIKKQYRTYLEDVELGEIQEFIVGDDYAL